MESLKERTHIALSQEAKRRLEQYKDSRQTWEEFLLGLLEKTGREAESVIQLPHEIELEEEMIKAVEEAQPPPEWRLLLIYALMGLVGGVGLGAFLALR